MKQQRTDPFQAIADPSRRAILAMLTENSHTINALAENFDMSRPAVSKHVKILTMAGFVMIKDIGRERHCTLNKDGFNEIRDWMGYYDKFWQSKLRRLDQLMKKRT